jgi:CCR4-NOT complex subunit CAF16
MTHSYPAIETTNLTYRFPLNKKVGLENVSLTIPWGTTNLVIGPNGAGKSTLLRILAGKTLIKQGKLRIGGFDPFEFSMARHEQHNSDINDYITYLGTEWANNPVVKRDIPVRLLISSIGGDRLAERRDELIDIMDLDPDWSMAYISDGERRRVQLVMGLLKPWRLLLLDEVTVDLDVVVRQRLLEFLGRETKKRDCCVIYATHIFDGMSRGWCDRVLHLNAGQITDDISTTNINFTTDGPEVKYADTVEIKRAESLHPLALYWLRNDLDERGTREEEREKAAKKNDWDNVRDGDYFDKNDKLQQYFKTSRNFT